MLTRKPVIRSPVRKPVLSRKPIISEEKYVLCVRQEAKHFTFYNQIFSPATEEHVRLLYKTMRTMPGKALFKMEDLTILSEDDFYKEESKAREHREKCNKKGVPFGSKV